MNTATRAASAPAIRASAQPSVLRRACAWLLAFAVAASLYSTAFDYRVKSNTTATFALLGGACIILAARLNWFGKWNWFGRFLRNSIGERTARVVIGLFGAAFICGAFVASMSR